MPFYKYKALDNNGKVIKGKYNALTKQEVLNKLKKTTCYPIYIEEIFEEKRTIHLNIFKKIKAKNISIFCRQFHAMLNAGITILNCLDTLRLQTENKKLRKIIENIYVNVQKGFTLSDSFRKHQEAFPDLLINIIETGEISGTLDIIIDRMAIYYEKEYKIVNKVKSAMIYPIVLSIIAIIVVIFILIFVMPTFVSMFEDSGISLPIPTQILLRISKGFHNFWYLIIIIAIAIIYGVSLFLKSSIGKFFLNQIILHIPIVKGVVQKIITSRFSRTLSTLLSSGIPLIQALDVVSRTIGNTIVEKGILEAKEEVRKGKDLATSIKNVGVFPPMLISMIRIGEESGSLDNVLDKTSNFYDDEVESALQKMVTILEPIMIVLMAFIVGFIVISLLLPMFDITNTITC